jgi:hypothetical protein
MLASMTGVSLCNCCYNTVVTVMSYAPNDRRLVQCCFSAFQQPGRSGRSVIQLWLLCVLQVAFPP